jgi:hypothetical protein
MLLQLRKEHPALRDGALWHIQMSDSLYAYARISNQEKILIAFNAGKTAQDWKIELAGTPLAGVSQFRSLTSSQILQVNGNSAALRLAPDECEIFIAQ